MDGIKVRGSFRLQLEEDGEIVGDSGWHENQITNVGFLNGIIGSISGLAGSTPITHVAIGTGTAPGAAVTILNGELTHVTSRQTLTAVTSSNSKAVGYRATFASGVSYITAAANISNIGLYGSVGTAASNLVAGNTYTSSTWATNQNLNVTYVLSFS